MQALHAGNTVQHEVEALVSASKGCIDCEAVGT